MSRSKPSDSTIELVPTTTSATSAFAAASAAAAIRASWSSASGSVPNWNDSAPARKSSWAPSSISKRRSIGVPATSVIGVVALGGVRNAAPRSSPTASRFSSMTSSPSTQTRPRPTIANPIRTVPLSAGV